MRHELVGASVARTGTASNHGAHVASVGSVGSIAHEPWRHDAGPSPGGKEASTIAGVAACSASPTSAARSIVDVVVGGVHRHQRDGVVRAGIPLTLVFTPTPTPTTRTVRCVFPGRGLSPSASALALDEQSERRAWRGTERRAAERCARVGPPRWALVGVLACAWIDDDQEKGESRPRTLRALRVKVLRYEEAG